MNTLDPQQKIQAAFVGQLVVAFVLLSLTALFPKLWFLLFFGLTWLFFVASYAGKLNDNSHTISNKKAWWGIFAVGFAYMFVVLYPLATLNTWWWTSYGLFWKFHAFIYFLVVAGLAAFCALFTFGLVFFLFIRKLRNTPIFSIIALPVIWEFAEIVRVKILFSLDWGIFGHILGENIFLARTTAFGGIFVLSSLAVLVNYCIFLLLKNVRGKNWRNWRNAFSFFWPALALTLVCAGIFLNNNLVLHRNFEGSQKIRIAIIGPNIKTEDISGQTGADHIFNLLQVATAPAASSTKNSLPQIVALPENIFPFLVIDETTEQPIDYKTNKLVRENFDRLLKISATNPKTSFVLGLHTQNSATTSAVSRFNSAIVLEAGKIVALYHKQDLLPLTEGGLSGLGDFSAFSNLKSAEIEPLTAGTGEKTLKSQYGTLSPLICSEVLVVPDEKDEFFGKNGSTWLFNLANDNVFDSPKVAEHDRISARLQAIERGEPLIRASKGGFSGIFDASGNEITQKSTESASSTNQTAQAGEILFVDVGYPRNRF